jgi:hypothetical protein
MSLNDDDEPKQQKKDGQDPEGEKAEEAIHADDLKKWEDRKAELSQKFEEETRQKWEQQLYNSRRANASGPLLIPTLGSGYSSEQLARQVTAEVNLKKAQWLNEERKNFFQELREAREKEQEGLNALREQDQKTLGESIERYADNPNRTPRQNYDALKPQPVALAVGREAEQGGRAAPSGRSENRDEPKRPDAPSSVPEVKKEAKETEAKRGEQRDDGRETTDAKQRRPAQSNRHPSRSGGNRHSTGGGRGGRGR